MFFKFCVIKIELNSKVLQNYFILFNKINNYYKAFSVSFFDQAHPEFSVSAQNFHFGASLPFTVTTHRALCLQPHAPLKDYTYTPTHTHTHTPVCRETFKRVYSPNNFNFMLLKNVLINVMCMDSTFLFHVSFLSTNFCLLQKPQSLLRRQ